MRIELPCPSLISQIPTLHELLVEFNRRDWYHYYFSAQTKFNASANLTLCSLTHACYTPSKTGRGAYDTSLTLEFNANPDSIRTLIHSQESKHTLNLTHLLTENTLPTLPAQEFLKNSILTQLLRQAHKSILSGELRNTYTDLELTIQRLRHPYIVLIPSLNGRTPLEASPEVQSRLLAATHQYSVAGTKLQVQSDTRYVAFRSEAEASLHLEKLFPSLSSETVTFLPVELRYTLGVFRCPWSAYEEGKNLSEKLIPYGRYRFDKEGFLVLARPLLFGEDWG